MLFIPATALQGDPTPHHWALAFVDGKLLLPEDDSALLLPLPDRGWQPYAEVRHYLGRLDGLDCWALRLGQVPEGWRPASLRAAMMGLPQALAGVAGRAAQVLDWDRTHRFCGACGTPHTQRANQTVHVLR